MKYLRLIRYQNLLMLALVQFIFRYGFLEMQNISLASTDFQFALLVLATMCIAAGGYIINNIFDIATDTDNKPNNVIVGKSISENSANNLYVAITVVGVSIGFYLSNVFDKPSFASIAIFVPATLYFYSASLKQSLLIGNIVVAAMLSFSLIVLGIFDLFPVTNDQNRPIMGMLFSIILDYAIFAFIINFIREIVKDLEDYQGDFNEGMRTLPIVLGITKTTKLLFILSFVPIFLILNYIKVHLFASQLIYSTLYGIAFVATPLLYFTIKIWSAKTSQDYHHLSTVLKWILFFGILSIAVVNLNIKHNA